MGLKLKHVPITVKDELVRRELSKYGDLALFQVHQAPKKQSKYCIFTYKEASDM